MKCIFKYLKVYLPIIIFTVTVKVIGTTIEFLIPYVLEHLLDDVAPTGDLKMVLVWGAIMISIAILVRALNVLANRNGARTARNCIYDIRKDLFNKTMNLSGNQVDKYGIPSLTSRMTSDSYNVQNSIRMMLAMGIRAPLLLFGGITVTLMMDTGLASVLLLLVPIIITIVITISRKGIPMYTKVQTSVDNIVRIMRENITGIRVVKALSKERYEHNRFEDKNEEMFKTDSTSSIVMSLPGPFTTLFLNIGLTVVVVYGSYRVNDGITQPGVILAFLTYFNMILMGVGGVNRIFIMLSKASASAGRISAVLMEGEDLVTVYGEDDDIQAEEYADKGVGLKAGSSTNRQADNDGATKGVSRETGKCHEYIEFDHVNFGYLKQGEQADELELTDISFKMDKGSSLGIIGATGSGKTTIINLLMRFYDATSGTVYVDGKDVKTMPLKKLRSKFGVVFQNDIIFADTLLQNITFGREVTREDALAATKDAQAYGFISQYEDGIEHEAEIHGANLSGGQKQRVLIARALAAKPDILVLDDSSSALDYKTDALLRQVIREKYNNTTSIIVAQRISSIMNLDNIIVLDDGKIVGMGKHDYLMENCELYREIYEVQMS